MSASTATLPKVKTKYNSSYHNSLLGRVLGEGQSIASFCSQANISKDTFYRWQKLYPDFKETYEIKINKAENLWEQKPLEDKTISFPYWHAIMRNRFGWGKSPLVKAEDDTYKARLIAARTSLEQRIISVDEYGKLISAILQDARAYELSARLDQKIKSEEDFEAMNANQLQEWLARNMKTTE